MKISNKRELQQISFNHSSDIDFKDFMNLYKNVLQNHILFQLLISLLHLIIFSVLERIFFKKYKNWSWQLMIRLVMKNFNAILRCIKSQSETKYFRHTHQV